MPPSLGDFGPLAVRADGTLLGTVSQPTDGAGLGPERLGTLAASGSFAEEGRTSQSQGIDAAARGRAQAFLTTTSTSLDVADWQLYGGRGGRVRLLAESRKLTPGKTPLAPEYRLVATDGAQAYWSAPQFLHQSTAADVAGTGFRSDIYSVALDGGRPRLVAKGAQMPAATGEGLWYVRQYPADPGLKGTAPQIRHRTAGGQDTRVLTTDTRQGPAVGALCVSTDRIAWTIAGARSDVVNVLDRRTGARRTITTRISPHATSLACGDGFVTWGGGSGNDDAGQYVLTRLNANPYPLGSARGAAWVDAGGSFIVYRREADGGRPQILVGEVDPTR